MLPSIVRKNKEKKNNTGKNMLSIIKNAITEEEKYQKIEALSTNRILKKIKNTIKKCSPEIGKVILSENYNSRNSNKIHFLFHKKIFSQQ